MIPRFFNQNIAAKLPLKKIPSTAAKAITRSANVASSLLIQFKAQFAFFATHGRFSTALNKKSLKKKSRFFNNVYHFSIFLLQIKKKNIFASYRKKVDKQDLLFFGIFDVGLDQKGIHLRMHILHGNLETIKAASFGNLDFLAEPFDEILVNDAIRSREECQNVRNEMTLVLVEIIPIGQIL